MLLILFLSCAGPDDEMLALKACELMPSFNVDAVAMFLSDGVFESSERALWEERVPSVGFDTVGVAGFGVVRANSTCAVTSRDGNAVTLTRTEPDVDPLTLEDRRDIKKLDMVDRTFTVNLLQAEGGARVTLAGASVESMRAAVAAAQALRDNNKYDEALKALKDQHALYPDPMLLWEMAEVEARRDATASFTWEIEDEEQLQIKHSGPRHVDLTVSLTAGDVTTTIDQEDFQPDMESTTTLSEEILAELEDGAELGVSIASISSFP